MDSWEAKVAEGREELQRIKDLSQSKANNSVKAILGKTHRIEYSSLACLLCVIFLLILNAVNNHKCNAAIEQNKIALEEMRTAIIAAIALDSE